MNMLKKIGALLFAATMLMAGLAPATSVAAAPGTKVYSVWNYKNVTTSATTAVKAGSGIFHGFCVNTVGTTSTLVIYDSNAGSGTKIGSFTTVAIGCYYFDAQFNTGLTAVTAGGAAGDITFMYM